MKILHIISAITSIAMLGSCNSSALPPKLSKTEEKWLSERPLPYSVGVQAYKFPVYSQSLAKALKDCGAFEQVLPLEEFDHAPDLIATVEESVHGTAVIPVLTFVSLGLIPTIVEERHGFRFALAPAASPKTKTQVDATYSGASTLGWAAIPINFSPGYTSGDPDASERFNRMLAYKSILALRKH